ncbi:MAG: hypothetical protein R3277_06755 [Brumimicrobium sp.]|nr:hypothetical protein [Brumimicrobium sp.]
MKTSKTALSIILTLTLGIVFFSCRKDKVPCLEDISIGNQGDYCPEMYDLRTKAYADSFHKSQSK